MVMEGAYQLFYLVRANGSGPLYLLEQFFFRIRLIAAIAALYGRLRDLDDGRQR